MLAISAAALNDVAGWLLLAAVSAIATATFTPGRTELQLAGVAGFSLFASSYCAPAAKRLLKTCDAADLDGHHPHCRVFAWHMHV